MVLLKGQLINLHVGEQWMKPAYSSLSMVANAMKKMPVLRVVEHHEYKLSSLQVRHMEMVCM